VEYIYRGVHTLKYLQNSGGKLVADIRELHSVSTGCKYSSCGTHVHMLHTNVTKESRPHFDQVVEELWLYKCQKIFIQKW